MCCLAICASSRRSGHESSDLLEDRCGFEPRGPGPLESRRSCRLPPAGAVVVPRGIERARDHGHPRHPVRLTWRRRGPGTPRRGLLRSTLASAGPSAELFSFVRSLRSDRPKQPRINRLRYRRLGRPATEFRRRPPAPLTEAGWASRDRKALVPTKLCNVKFVRAGPRPGQDHGPASGLVRRPLLRGCGRTTRWRRAAGRGWARSSPMSG
jgi:hypothetical protein